MLESHDAALLEEHLRQRIDALREDVREMEHRIGAQIMATTTRLTLLEGWQNQMIGASKAGRLLWAALASLLVGLFALGTWLYEHFKH